MTDNTQPKVSFWDRIKKWAAYIPKLVPIVIEVIKKAKSEKKDV